MAFADGSSSSSPPRSGTIDSPLLSARVGLVVLVLVHGRDGAVVGQLVGLGFFTFLGFLGDGRDRLASSLNSLGLLDEA